jgi:hypothetical protein
VLVCTSHQVPPEFLVERFAIASAQGCRSSACGRRRSGYVVARLAAVFFVAPGELLASVVQEPLTDVLPDRFRTVEPDGIQFLDLDGPAATPVAHPQYMLGELAQSHLPSGALARAWPVSTRGAARSACRYSGGRLSSGARPRTGGAFLPTPSGHLVHLLRTRHAAAGGCLLMPKKNI